MPKSSLTTYLFKFSLGVIAVCALSVGIVRGQDPRLPGMPGYEDPYGYGDVIYDEFGNPIEEPIGQDSAKVKIRKPLESYFFDDSIRSREIFAWHIDTWRNEVHMTAVDTTINGYQKEWPFQKKGVGEIWQGNMGGASLPISYFDRPQYRNFNFAQSFDTYYFMPENTMFFNVKKAYTNFAYYTAGQTRRREEGFAITHAQNISPSSGFNIDYNSRGTRGYYQWDKGRAKNLSMAFNHTGKKYTIHAGYIYNTINNKENGGLVNDRDITGELIELPQTIPVNLTDARTVIKSNTWYLVQSYGIPLRRLTEEDFTISDQSSIFVGHSTVYHRWGKSYTDNRAYTTENRYTPPEDDPDYYKIKNGEFYENWYIDPLDTRDTIFETLLSNRVFVQLQPWDRNGIVGLIDAGAGVDLHRYYQFVPQSFLTGKLPEDQFTEYYLYGSVQGRFREYFLWDANINFHPTGYRSGDLRIGAHAAFSAFFRGRPVTLSGRFFTDLRSPSYWTEKFISNHYMWENSFAKENETRFEFSLEIPAWALELSLGQSTLTDKIYYNSEALPVQHSGSVSVMGLYARKDFRFGGFHLNHRVMLQWSTSQVVVPVPLASAFINYYFEFDVVRNALRAQIGINGRYYTEYHAFGYMPATATIYNQREKKLGNYPFFDFYVSGKWKRMRILLKMEHVNENLFGTRNYFDFAHYPLKKRAFKMGFSWAFYD